MNGYFEVDLAPTTSAKICFLPKPSSTPHVMLRSVEVVVVQSSRATAVRPH